MRRLVGGVGLILGVLATPSAAEVELHVYAAASLRDVLVEIAPEVERTTDTRLVFNWGGSGDLARQIVAARKADVYFSADVEWMDFLDQKDLVDRASRRQSVSNHLVVITPRSRPMEGSPVEALRAAPRIALANPDLVPAGKYAKTWLTTVGLWEQVSPRVVPTLDVRAALAAVESGAVPIGVVYRTDAAMSKRVVVLGEVRDGEAPQIRYAVAAVAGRPQLERARSAAEALDGPAARRIFARHGFVVTP